MAIKQLKAVPRQTTMRDIVALAASPTVDKVSGFNFRSEEEVKEFLDRLNLQLKDLTTHLTGMEKLFSSVKLNRVQAANSITIDRTGNGPTRVGDDSVGVGKITIPNIGKLKENFAIVSEISDKLDMLDTLEVQAQHLFRSERGNKIPAMLKATKLGYEKKLKQALNFLKTVAKKHEPTEFLKLVEGVTNYFKDGFKNKYKSAEEHVFVTTKTTTGADGKDRQILVFNHYVQFTELTNEHLEYTYPTYVIVFTALVNEKGQMKLFVNTLHKFRAPGSFKPGSEFTNLKTGVNALSNLFEVDDFVDLLDRQPVPVSKDKIWVKNFKAKEFIKGVEVEDRKIIVMFNSKANKTNIQNLAVQVFADIRGLFSMHMKSQIRYKIIPPAKGMEFILTLPTGVDSSKFLNADKIDHLKDALGMDDEDIRNLVKVFNKGHA